MKREVSMIFGIENGKEKEIYVVLDECTLLELLYLNEFSKGTGSNSVISAAIYRRLDDKYNPEKIVYCKRLTKKNLNPHRNRIVKEIHK